MDMLPTVEVRWFRPGAIDPGVQDWFGKLPGLPEEQPERIDHYLPVAAGGPLGIKVREGRLEIKQRIEQLGIRNLHPVMAGSIERWRKWSFELADAASAPSSHRAWTAVTKRRKLYRYRVTGNEVIEELPLTEEVAWGCDVELTSVVIGDSAWWTVGMEAFGQVHSLEDKLLLTARAILNLCRPPPFAAENSSGYPRWLARVTGEAGSH